MWRCKWKLCVSWTHALYRSPHRCPLHMPSSHAIVACHRHMPSSHCHRHMPSLPHRCPLHIVASSLSSTHAALCVLDTCALQVATSCTLTSQLRVCTHACSMFTHAHTHTKKHTHTHTQHTHITHTIQNTLCSRTLADNVQPLCVGRVSNGSGHIHRRSGVLELRRCWPWWVHYLGVMKSSVGQNHIHKPKIWCPGAAALLALVCTLFEGLARTIHL